MHLRRTFLFSLIIFLTNTQSQCGRILAIQPFPAKSHMAVFSELTVELAHRGHELVVVSAFPLSKPMANYTDIDIMGKVREEQERMMNEKLYEGAELPMFLRPIVIWNKGLHVTDMVINISEVKQLLEDKRGFDLVIVEAFINEAFYGFADFFKAPLVLLAPFGGFRIVNDGAANPTPLSYVPNCMLPLSDQMTFFERLKNIVFTLFWDIGQQFYYLPRQEAIRKKIFGDQGKNVWELSNYVSLTLLNSHISLSYPRPLVPSIIEVGGMHVKQKSKKLPADIQDFLDGAREGVILFSMGSNLRSDKMPVEKRNAFVAAFAALPQRVLWKWESDEMPGLSPNVKISKWLPQQDILAHPNLQVFIMHGGLLSLQEATYHGVPVVGIPVFGDQSLNMHKAELGGYGVKLSLKNVTKQSILWALGTVLHDNSFQREAQRRSAIFRDQSETPLERAAFWTEYVLRHKGAHHLRTAATNLAWYQLYLLDVAAVFLAALVIFFYMLRALKSLCFRTQKQKISDKKVKEKKKK
ncbi:UDP-glycosyltransferase-10 [Ephemera danica]|nr:UDP-glycosyltransferase-10 [Ephemera danica]